MCAFWFTTKDLCEPELGHAPFWDAPGDFDPILERFLQDVESGRAATRTL
jgi:hypothetical protein